MSNDFLNFERDKLKTELAKERQASKERERRQTLLLRDTLEERKYACKRAEEERKKRAKRAKALRKLQPHLPKKKKQGRPLSRRRSIGLF